MSFNFQHTHLGILDVVRGLFPKSTLSHSAVEILPMVSARSLQSLVPGCTDVQVHVHFLT